MKKLLVFLILLCLAGYAAFKAGAWYQTTRAINQFKQATELQLAMSHGWISSSLSGEVAIEDVVITPFQFREPIPVERIVVRFDSVWDMLSYLSPFSLTEPVVMPPSASLDIEHAKVSLDGNWAGLAGDAETPQGFFGLACGDIQQIGVAELKEMGYEVLDTTLSVSWDQSGSDLNLHTDLLIDGMYRTIVDTGLAGFRWPTEGQVPAPAISNLKLVHEDLSYMKRLMLLCGKRAGLDEPGFIQASVDKTRRELAAAGIYPNETMLKAYRVFLKGDGIAEVLFDPAEPVDMGVLPFIEPEKWPENLGFSLKLNRVAIPDAAFAVDIEKLSAYLFPPEPVAPPPEPEPEPVIDTGPAYEAVAVEELELYVDMPARVTQTSGKVTEGTLTAVEPYQIILEQRLQTGSVSFFIKKTDIDVAQILK